MNRRSIAGMRGAVLKAVLSAAMLVCLCGCSLFKPTESMDLGYRSLSENDYRAALEYFNDAITDGESPEESWRGKGIALMGLGRYDEAVKAFENALKNRSELEEKIYDDSMEKDIRAYMAGACFKSGDTQKALDLYTELLAEDGENASLYTLRGTVYAQIGDATSARSDFNKAINLDRSNYDRLYEIAVILEESGMKDLGRTYLEGALAKGDGTMDTLVRGRFLCYLERYDEAAQVLETQTASDTATVLQLAQAYQNLDRREDAVELLAKYQENTGDNASLMCLMGILQMEEEHYDLAVEAFERGLAVAEAGSSERASLLFNRAVVYEYMGDYKTAENYMAEYVGEFPADTEAARELEFLKTR